MAERRLKRLPTEAAPPQFTAKDLGELGTANADALAIKTKAIFSAAELARKSDEAMARREAAGISDRVERLQGEVPPFTQQLVGKRLEVLWKYMLPDGSSQLIWASGRVTRVADGLTDKRSQRARRICCRAVRCCGHGMRTLEFGEVAGEKWLVLLPNKWNPPKATVYGWRWDPRELSPAAAAPARDERCRGARRMEE